MEKLNILENVVLTDGATFNALREAGEKSDYSSFKITHGYGKLARAGAALTKGVTGTVDVKITVSTYQESSYHAVIDDVRTVIDEQILTKLDECEKKKQHADWWFWFVSKSASDYEHHKKSKQETIHDMDEKKTHALEDNFSNEKQNFELEGHFTVVGQSMIPTEVYLFVEMLNIETKDGQSINVFNDTTIAASENGDTSVAKIDGPSTLNVIPI